MKKIEIKTCTTFRSRFLGFMGKKHIKYGLCFPHCNSIHTFFMKEPIDIVMTDKNHNILHLYPSVRPWKIILPKKHVYYTYEFPNHYIEQMHLLK